MAKFWTVRTGRSGERTEWGFANGVVGGGWHEIPDLTHVNDKEQLRGIVSETYGGSKNVVGNLTGQLWSLRSRIQDGDYIVLPIRATSQVAFGQVRDGYKYLAEQEDPGKRHVIQVNWIRTDVPKSLLKQDMLYQLGSALTIFEVGNNDAAFRLERVMSGKQDPGVRSALNVVNKEPNEATETSSEDSSSTGFSINLAEVAHDEIAKRLQEDFKGHELSELVEALLTAEGFKCRNSPPGADGGVDVLAGMGPLGMDSPKLVVQVKSQTGAVGDDVLQKLNGAIHRFKADQALLVTFGGVTGPAKSYLEGQYFNIRVWTIDDILQAIYRHYPVLDNEMKARLPLKQIWVPIDPEA
jgi:restriction system protein